MALRVRRADLQSLRCEGPRTCPYTFGTATAKGRRTARAAAPAGRTLNDTNKPEGHRPPAPGSAEYSEGTAESKRARGGASHGIAPSTPSTPSADVAAASGEPRGVRPCPLYAASLSSHYWLLASRAGKAPLRAQIDQGFQAWQRRKMKIVGNVPNSHRKM